MKKFKQAVLIILDGWGHSENPENNAVHQANTPFFDYLWNNYPKTLLQASGPYVGLPNGQMGNSEIGHTTIGAGKIIDTDLVRIEKAIKSGEFENNPAFIELFDHVKKNNSTLHVKGLLGNGGVHSHSDHLFAFLKAAKKAGIEKLAIHVFTDGRDTAPQSSAKFLKELEEEIEKTGIGFIATATGRFYAMDRDNNWDRIKKAEDALFECKGNICKPNEKPSDVIANLHKEGILDEHLEPVVFLDENGKSYPIRKNDGVMFFNFRADRARQITENILNRKDQNIFFVSLTEYKKDFSKMGNKVAFPPIEINSTLAKEISKNNLTQAHIAETEKFPHATYFLNGGIETLYPGEKHILLDSRKDIKTHDEAPEMRAEAIADKAIEEIEANTNFIFINFANADMVGHTANIPAIIKSIEAVDISLKRIYEVLSKKQDSIAFITADHGNAELNIDPVTGEKHTAHTLNPVPAIATSKGVYFKEIKREAGLSDIAPTILSLLNIEKPKEMTGEILLD